MSKFSMQMQVLRANHNHISNVMKIIMLYNQAFKMYKKSEEKRFEKVKIT